METFVIFKDIKYKMIFTNHAMDRMTERGIKIDILKLSIEEFDVNYKKYNKEIVEKTINKGTIRTVFRIKTNHIILITSMILGK